MKLGDKVKLSELGKNEYPDDDTNPHKLDGEINSVSRGLLPIRITWSNGKQNSYFPEDLELIEESGTEYSSEI